MSEIPQFNLAQTTLSDEQFAILHMSEPGSNAATKVLDEIDMIGRVGDFAIYMQGDECGNRTAKLVALSLMHQGDVLLNETAKGMGYPSASEAYRQIAATQAQAIDTPDSRFALDQLTARAGQSGSR